MKNLRHKPMMPAEKVERLKAWQEEVYKKLLMTEKEGFISVNGSEYIIRPGMFAPKWMDSSTLSEVISKNVKKGETVLDLGTGSGIQGITAAKAGGIVTAVDINLIALKCARENAVKHAVSDKITFLESDLFSNIKDKFDVILFNPPFRWFKPRDLLERGELDEDYKTLISFFAEAKDHLNDQGRILLVFSDSGDIKFLEHLITENGFRFETLVERKEPNSGWTYTVYEIRSY